MIGMIIGLTGTKASGKGVLSEMLKQRGFEYFSSSDIVREEAVARGIENYKINDLQDIATELRSKYGLGEIIRRTIEKAKGIDNVIIDGIRNLGDIEELKKSGAIIIGVDAPLQTRYERLIERGRASDPNNWEDFIKTDRKDKGVNETGSGQQVAACIEAAHYKIDNNSNLRELELKITQVINHIEKIQLVKKELDEKKEVKKERPSWDEYFMSIAVITASRSSCLRFHTGAIIVQDNRIVSTGYNGNPSGVTSCYEQGFCNKEKANINLLKKGSGHCLAAHGETNAILQAGRDKTKDAKMYSLLFPCNECAKLIVNSGIKELIYLFDYKEEVPKAEEMLKAAGIKFKKMELSEERINEMVRRTYTQKSLSL